MSDLFRCAEPGKMGDHDGEDQRKAAAVDAVDPRLGDLLAELGGFGLRA